MINRREVLKMAGGLAASAMFPVLGSAKTNVKTIGMCPEFLIELKERQKIWLKHSLVHDISNPIDAYNTACLLETHAIASVNDSSVLTQIASKLIRKISPCLSDFFNVWTMRGPEDCLYWQIDNEIIQDKKPISAHTRMLRTQISTSSPILSNDLFEILSFEIQHGLIREGLGVLLKNVPIIRCKAKQVQQTIAQACEEIHQQTNLTANYMVAGDEIIYPCFLSDEKFQSEIGINHVGDYNNLKAYTDALFPVNTILVGHKGDFTGGYAITPYNLQWVSDSYVGRTTAFWRYNHRMRSNKMYRVIKIED